MLDIIPRNNTFLKHVTERSKVITPIQPDQPTVINMLDRFCNRFQIEYFRRQENIILNPVNLKHLSAEAECFKVLRTMINARVFINNKDLQNRISKFNNLMALKLDEI